METKEGKKEEEKKITKRTIKIIKNDNLKK